jgi:hypothetical protein
VLTRILIIVAAAAAACALAFTAADRGGAAPAAMATPAPIAVDAVAVTVPRFASGPVPDLAPKPRHARHRAAPTKALDPQPTGSPRRSAAADWPASPTGRRPWRKPRRRVEASPGAPVDAGPAPAPTATPAPAAPVQEPAEDDAPPEEELAE